MKEDGIVFVANDVYQRILIDCMDSNNEVFLADIVTVVICVLDKFFDEFSKKNNISKHDFYERLIRVLPGGEH